MRQVRILFVLAATALLVACAPGSGVRGEDDDDGHGGAPDADTNHGFIDAAPFVDAGGFANDGGGNSNGACDKMDILFVIDNSGSMAEEQDALAAAFPQFVSVIESYVTSTGNHLDYHVGVTTTDHGDGLFPGDDGALINVSKLTSAACPFPGGRRFLQRGDANVPNAFSCAAKLGTDGSGFEMPLQSAKLALVDRMTGSPATNAGFLREDALLAIVLVTDENDCSTVSAPGFLSSPATYCAGSLEPVASYVAAFDTVKGGERARWATAIIAIPPGAGQCGGPESSENVRLKQFTDMTGPNAVFTNICSGNMAMSLQQAFETFGVACENIPVD